MVAVVRRQLGTRRVGHAGTLDPFATGLLVVLVGKATRLARFVEGLPKRYDAVIRFGSATDTDDSTGAVTQAMTPAIWPDAALVAAAAASFTGVYAQRPPAYSAKHVAGTRSHVLARRGEAVELAARDVTVHAIDLGEWTPPDLTLQAMVSRGTYVRVLARDLGERLGIPAHCAALRRTAIGPFDVAAAVAPEPIDRSRLLSPAALLPELPCEVLETAALRDVAMGRSVPQRESHDGPGALLGEDGHLAAVANGRAGRWLPEVVLEEMT